ncbi:hypothetical protein SARC_07699 [Sphaeroforma arctica JP610]|uniref:C2H2-type domain-containing protein n=1 Tax=Sphaeroforma arctica JP610 TaxID=667725 RepID=A0A0L0FVF9_9EUKA|nr:hypothetical protein SARC_07699 [Sphaeroforma arctica JP610]KNC79928.1 hypothetical protein SARC_07699 [Sphaeroforma arctica JP610]|eukprot:XP_014153830.1 hypothetical protein SARC_07699 [Sphaeroforma arctica JP610]
MQHPIVQQQHQQPVRMRSSVCPDDTEIYNVQDSERGGEIDNVQSRQARQPEGGQKQTGPVSTFAGRPFGSSPAIRQGQSSDHCGQRQSLNISAQLTSERTSAAIHQHPYEHTPEWCSQVHHKGQIRSQSSYHNLQQTQSQPPQAAPNRQNSNGYSGGHLHTGHNHVQRHHSMGQQQKREVMSLNQDQVQAYAQQNFAQPEHMHSNPHQHRQRTFHHAPMRQRQRVPHVPLSVSVSEKPMQKRKVAPTSSSEQSSSESFDDVRPHQTQYAATGVVGANMPRHLQFKRGIEHRENEFSRHVGTTDAVLDQRGSTRTGTLPCSCGQSNGTGLQQSIHMIPNSNGHNMCSTEQVPLRQSEGDGANCRIIGGSISTEVPSGSGSGSGSGNDNNNEHASSQVKFQRLNGPHKIQETSNQQRSESSGMPGDVNSQTQAMKLQANAGSGMNPNLYFGGNGGGSSTERQSGSNGSNSDEQERTNTQPRVTSMGNYFMQTLSRDARVSEEQTASAGSNSEEQKIQTCQHNLAYNRQQTCTCNHSMNTQPKSNTESMQHEMVMGMDSSAQRTGSARQEVQQWQASSSNRGGGAFPIRTGFTAKDDASGQLDVQRQPARTKRRSPGPDQPTHDHDQVHHQQCHVQSHIQQFRFPDMFVSTASDGRSGESQQTLHGGKGECARGPFAPLHNSEPKTAGPNATANSNSVNTLQGDRAMLPNQDLFQEMYQHRQHHNECQCQQQEQHQHQHQQHQEQHQHQHQQHQHQQLHRGINQVMSRPPPRAISAPGAAGGRDISRSDSTNSDSFESGWSASIEMGYNPTSSGNLNQQMGPSQSQIKFAGGPQERQHVIMYHGSVPNGTRIANGNKTASVYANNTQERARDGDFTDLQTTSQGSTSEEGLSSSEDGFKLQSELQQQAQNQNQQQSQSQSQSRNMVLDGNGGAHVGHQAQQREGLSSGTCVPIPNDNLNTAVESHEVSNRGEAHLQTNNGQNICLSASMDPSQRTRNMYNNSATVQEQQLSQEASMHQHYQPQQQRHQEQRRQQHQNVNQRGAHGPPPPAAAVDGGGGGGNMSSSDVTNSDTFESSSSGSASMQYNTETSGNRDQQSIPSQNQRHYAEGLVERQNTSFYSEPPQARNGEFEDMQKTSNSQTSEEVPVSSEASTDSQLKKEQPRLQCQLQKLVDTQDQVSTEVQEDSSTGEDRSQTTDEMTVDSKRAQQSDKADVSQMELNNPNSRTLPTSNTMSTTGSSDGSSSQGASNTPTTMEEDNNATDTGKNKLASEKPWKESDGVASASTNTGDDSSNKVEKSEAAENTSTKIAGSRVHACTWEGCSKSFLRLDHFRRHMKTHTGQKPFACTWEGCDKRFNQTNNLTRHLKTHTGEKPYLCPWEGCNKRLGEASNLTRHLRLHTGRKPFPCTWEGCGKSFADASYLSAHMRVHARSGVFKCTWEGCEKTFAAPSYVRRHLRTHTNEQPYECQTCGKRFNQGSNLSRHMRTHKAGDGSSVATKSASSGSKSELTDTPRDSAKGTVHRVKKGKAKPKVKV